MRLILKRIFPRTRRDAGHSAKSHQEIDAFEDKLPREEVHHTFDKTSFVSYH